MTNKMKWLYQNGYFKNLLKIKLKNYTILNQRQIARDNIELDDKELNKDLGKKMLVLLYW